MVRTWHGLGMASVNQTRSHCVNQMEMTHSKPLAARHGRGTAWARHAMCESAFSHNVATRRLTDREFSYLYPGMFRTCGNLTNQLHLVMITFFDFVGQLEYDVF